MDIKYSYRDVPTVHKFSKSDAFMRLLLGPFGSGKSSGCVVELVKRAMTQKAGPDGIKRSRFLVVRNTYRQLNDSTIRTVHQWLPPHHFGNYKQSDQSYVITAFKGVHTELLYRALDRPDHVGNLLSLEVTGAWVNEAREVPWAIIEAIQGRVGRYPSAREGGVEWYGVWLDSNPSDVDSRLYKYFVEEEHNPAQVQLFMQPSGLGDAAENLSNLPGGKAYYEKMSYGKDPEWVKVYCHGRWGFVSDGRPVYWEYSDAVHCNEQIKSIGGEPVYRGWDFGLTPAAVFCQVSPRGQFLVIDEMISENMGVDNFSDEVIEYSSKYYPDTEFIDIGDPAGEQRAQTDERSCFDLLKGKGIWIEAGVQTPTIRLESVRKPLTRLVDGRPGFQMHPRCKQLRKGFMGGYCFRRLQTSSERYTEKPDKNMYSHVHDALQYVCGRIFGGGLTTPKVPPGYESPGEHEFTNYQRSDVTGY